jgi:hypothetical protein
MDAFHKDYFKLHALSTINTNTLRSTLYDWLVERNGSNIANDMVSKINWDFWVYAADNAPIEDLNFVTPNITAATNLAIKYTTTPDDVTESDYQVYNGWSSTVKTIFNIELTN